MNLKIYIRHYRAYWLLFFVLIFSSCAQFPGKKPLETIQGQVPGRSGEILDERQTFRPKVSLYDILSSEARKFAVQGDFQNALFVYNQAYAQADEAQKQALIPQIEALLAQTPSKDIEQFARIANVSIPQGLLQYWLGLTLALENENYKSKQVLESFLKTYPDHRYFSDATDLLDIINKALSRENIIGCLLPVSGKYAVFGEQALAGIQLAVQELTQKYGSKFNLIIEDTQADPVKAAKGVDRLVEKNARAIIGPLLTTESAGQRAQALGIPMIALTQKEDFAEQGDYLFSNFITPHMQVQTLGSYLFGELGITKVAVLYPNEKYGKKYMDLFWDMADEYNVQVVGAQMYDTKGTDFTKSLQKLTGEYYPLPDFLKPEPEEPVNTESDEGENAEAGKKEKEPVEIDFQALFIPDSPSKIKLILPQLAFNDITDIYLVGTNLWHHPSLLKKELRTYTQNAIIADGFFDKSRNPATIDFSKNFESLFGRKPVFLEAVSYDTAGILFSLMMDESIDSAHALKTALQGGRMFEGATGVTVFDENGNAHRQLFLITIKKNKFIEISH